MSGCLFGLALICFVIGFVQLVAPDPAKRKQAAVAPAPRGEFRPAAPAPVREAVSPAAPLTTGGSVNMKLQKLDWIKVGQRIYTKHPVKGELMSHVLGRIVYAELWQQGSGPQVPWTPTGNIFAGFWLEGDLFLLNWQNRFYLLDEGVELSDAEIQRDFLPHARKFAQSNQTADVYFAYPPAMWHIDDIGKFRVEKTEGEGLRFRPGAIGRFIHATGEGGRALVVEDYEGGGGGQDTAWTGYTLAEEEIKPA